MVEVLMQGDFERAELWSDELLIISNLTFETSSIETADGWMDIFSNFCWVCIYISLR